MAVLYHNTPNLISNFIHCTLSPSGCTSEYFPIILAILSTMKVKPKVLYNAHPQCLFFFFFLFFFIFFFLFIYLFIFFFFPPPRSLQCNDYVTPSSSTSQASNLQSSNNVTPAVLYHNAPPSSTVLLNENEHNLKADKTSLPC